MERKRKLPARAAREGGTRKKRTSTPPEPRTKTSTRSPSVPTPVPEETLPKSITSGKALPTVDTPQPENLSSKEFQSISESGVLAESLQRSKQKWLSEGIFERYWTKPSKKKGVLEQPENNPAKDTMTKLGPCTITIEPHIFDAVMYAIKDPNPRPIPPPAQQPLFRPILQYGPPGGMMPPPVPTPPPKQFPTPRPTPQGSPNYHDPHMGTNGPPTATNNIHTPIPNPAQTPTNNDQSNGAPNHPQTPATANPTPAAPTSRSTDPVIQMLAERAATDPDLKALMRIVANGEATPEELRRFQGHIDELTRIQKEREAANPQSQNRHQPPPPPPSAVTHVNGYNPNHVSSQSISTPTRPAQISASPFSLPRGQPHPQAQPQALRSKGPVPSSKPDITGVVFEFPGGSGDRFQFPKFSILEHLPQGQVIASFLIVRKGSSSDSPTYVPELDYYQPITIRLYAQQGRQLDALSKIVAPVEEVRRYMDEVMDNATRAEYVLLAMRLPKDKEQSPIPIEKEEETEKAIQMENILQWPTTSSTLVVKSKPTKKIPTEAEKYQSFIAGVATEVM